MSANDELQAHTCEKMLQEYGNVAQQNSQDLERVADTSKTIIVEKEVYEAVLRNSLRVCDLEKENEDLISRKNWCNARAKKILEKNKQLKQLLKECREELDMYDTYTDFNEVGRAKLLTKIDEVLK